MKNKKIWLGAILCLGVGVITGLLGGGGGMLCVPILSCCFGLSTKNAHASALLVMLITSIGSLFFYITNTSIKIDFILLGVISAILIAGSFVGSKFLSICKSKIITIIFAFVMLGSGLYMVIK